MNSSLRSGEIRAPNHDDVKRIRTRSRDHAGAERRLREAVEVNPWNDVAYMYLALAVMSRGDGAEAEKCLRRAVEINPGNGLAHTNLAVALFNRDATGEARAHCVEALRINPDNVSAQSLLKMIDG